MITNLIRVTILVRDQDEALKFYTDTLGLEKREDATFGPGMRWLTVAPKGQQGIEIVLQQPHPGMHGEENAAQMQELVGRGTTWVFACDDCRTTYAELRGRGVEFQSEPREQPYGIEAVFVDLYGNSFSLLQPAPTPASASGDVQTQATDAQSARSNDKSQILSSWRANHDELQNAIAGLDEAQMTAPGANGSWSVQDVLAHVASGNEWLIAELERATRGEGPDWAAIQRQQEAGLFDNETRNRVDYEHYKDMPLAEALDWWQRSTERLLAAIEATPQDALSASDWWTGERGRGESLWPEHEAEHAATIRAWRETGAAPQPAEEAGTHTNGQASSDGN
jgi:uncharacterized protein (TIGR03083 family)